MDVYNESILNFWKCLNKNDVKYIMVGGFAINFHGYSRFTADMDIWIKDTLENRKKLRAAYAESGNGNFIELETMQFVAGWSKIYLEGSMELDIMSNLVGFEQLDFDNCYKLAPIAKIHDVSIKFLHINHLIEEKKAAGRPKDLLDVEELEKIKKATDSID